MTSGRFVDEGDEVRDAPFDVGDMRIDGAESGFIQGECDHLGRVRIAVENCDEWSIDVLGHMCTSGCGSRRRTRVSGATTQAG